MHGDLFRVSRRGDGDGGGGRCVEADESRVEREASSRGERRDSAPLLPSICHYPPPPPLPPPPLESRERNKIEREARVVALLVFSPLRACSPSPSPVLTLTMGLFGTTTTSWVTAVPSAPLHTAQPGSSSKRERERNFHPRLLFFPSNLYYYLLGPGSSRFLSPLHNPPAFLVRPHGHDQV